MVGPTCFSSPHPSISSIIRHALSLISLALCAARMVVDGGVTGRAPRRWAAPRKIVGATVAMTSWRRRGSRWGRRRASGEARNGFEMRVATTCAAPLRSRLTIEREGKRRERGWESMTSWTHQFSLKENVVWVATRTPHRIKSLWIGSRWVIRPI